MSSNGSNSIKNFFRIMGVCAIILSIRVPIVTGVTYDAVRAIWLTFLFIFSILPIAGIVGMALIDIYGFIKELINKEKVIQFIEYLHGKFNEEGQWVIVGSGMIGGTLTAVFLFDGTWPGALKSMMAIAGTFMSIIGGIVAKDIYAYAKPKIIKYVQNKLYGKKRKRSNKRAA